MSNYYFTAALIGVEKAKEKGHYKIEWPGTAKKMGDCVTEFKGEYKFWYNTPDKSTHLVTITENEILEHLKKETING